METSALRQKTCCFTGHRALPAESIRTITQRTALEVRDLIENKGVRFFGVGGAKGYDTLAADVLFQLREKEFPDIKIILVYPFNGFTSRWAAEQKAVYDRFLPMYNKLVCVSDTPSKEAYLARNRHLVDHSAFCISYCTRSVGGTAYTVRYAAHCGLELRNVAR